MSKPEDSKYICWIDLETTGNTKEHLIIEIGAVMTDRDFNELSSKQIVLEYPIALVPTLDPIVQKMHTDNGLWDECEVAEDDYFTADAKMVEWIRQFTKGDHIPMSGSGVAHFDFPKFVERQLPELTKYLAYWQYDVGGFRRMLRWFGIPIVDESKTDIKTHRALDDIREHIAETKSYRDQLRAAFERPTGLQTLNAYIDYIEEGRTGWTKTVDSAGNPI